MNLTLFGQVMPWNLINISSGPHFLFGVSSDYAQPTTGQFTEVTCPVIGRAQPELTLSKRQKTGPGNGLVSCSVPSYDLNNVDPFRMKPLRSKFNANFIKLQQFSFKKWIWKCYLQNDGYLVWASMSQNGLLFHFMGCGMVSNYWRLNISVP